MLQEEVRLVVGGYVEGEVAGSGGSQEEGHGLGLRKAWG